MDSNNAKKPKIFIMEFDSRKLREELSLSLIKHQARGNMNEYTNDLAYYVREDSSKEEKKTAQGIFNTDDQKKFVMNLIENNIDLYIKPIWNYTLESDIMNLIKDEEIAAKVNFQIMTKDGQIYDLNVEKLKEQNYMISEDRLIDYAKSPNLAMNHENNEELTIELKNKSSCTII